MRSANAIHPPVEASLLQHIPSIERISPPLSRFAEVVRRHARYSNRRKVFIELKNIAVRPYIRAVVIHKNGDIADKSDISLSTVFAQRRPLFIKSKLNYLLDGQLF